MGVCTKARKGMTAEGGMGGTSVEETHKFVHTYKVRTISKKLVFCSNCSYTCTVALFYAHIHI